jgi:carboxyl-terminal processing protease
MLSTTTPSPSRAPSPPTAARAMRTRSPRTARASVRARRAACARAGRDASGDVVTRTGRAPFDARDGASWRSDDARREAMPRVAMRAAVGAVVAMAVAASDAEAITENQMLYLEAWRAVDKAYVDKTFNGVNWFKLRETGLKNDDLDDRETTYEVIRAMLAKLDDPFTRFLEPEKYSSVTEQTMKADVSGVGIEMGFDDDKKIIVVAPTPGGPASEAGVKAKDLIYAVDGAPTVDKSLYEVAEELQGPQGSKVTLSVDRGGKQSDIVVQRKRYTVVPVTSTTCDVGENKKIGYVKLSAFNQVSGVKTKEALKALKAEGVDSYVLDLRNNVGGLFPGALEIAKALMNEGTIVYIADSSGERDVFEADRSALDADTPLRLLVNKGTASASEVLAGALRDNNRATILGETTFGKGLIQTLVPLSDGSAVSVTVAQYRTPLGTNINKVGIVPDKPLPLNDAGEDVVPANADDFCAYARTAPDLFL